MIEKQRRMSHSPLTSLHRILSPTYNLKISSNNVFLASYLGIRLLFKYFDQFLIHDYRSA